MILNTICTKFHFTDPAPCHSTLCTSYCITTT